MRRTRLHCDSPGASWTIFDRSVGRGEEPHLLLQAMAVVLEDRVAGAVAHQVGRGSGRAAAVGDQTSPVSSSRR